MVSRGTLVLGSRDGATRVTEATFDSGFRADMRQGLQEDKHDALIEKGESMMYIFLGAAHEVYRPLALHILR